MVVRRDQQDALVSALAAVAGFRVALDGLAPALQRFQAFYTKSCTAFPVGSERQLSADFFLRQFSQGRLDDNGFLERFVGLWYVLGPERFDIRVVLVVPVARRIYGRRC